MLPRGCFRWKDWDKQCRRLSSGVGLFQQCVPVLWERCGFIPTVRTSPLGEVALRTWTVLGDHASSLGWGVVWPTLPPYCGAGFAFRIHLRDKNGSGMGLLASPTLEPCRGWGWTHSRAIPDGQYGTWMGLAHFRRGSRARMGLALPLWIMSMSGMGPCPTNPIPARDRTYPIPVKSGHVPYP
jgi:hypothetical protein